MPAQTDDGYSTAVEFEVTGNREGSADHTDVLFVQYRGLFRDVLGRKCVYSPSCSHYAQEAIGTRGPVFGLMMALERWTRCTSAAFGYEDYIIDSNNKLLDPVEPGEEVTCWGRILLPF